MIGQSKQAGMQVSLNTSVAATSLPNGTVPRTAGVVVVPIVLGAVAFVFAARRLG